MNQIICGDALEEMRKLPDGSVDLVVTDIPYDINVKQGAGAYGTRKNWNVVQTLSTLSDGITDEVLEELCRVMKRINIYIFCSKAQIPHLLEFFLAKKCNWQLITWHKDNAIPACGNSYMPDTEYCLFFRERGVKVMGTAKTKATYYVTHRNDKDRNRFDHPTPKPLHIIKNFIINSSREGDIILDPYLGSGTTAQAAFELGRNYIGIEINESYCKTAEERINEARANQQQYIRA